MFCVPVLEKKWNYALSRSGSETTTKKCTKKAWWTCKVVILPFSLPFLSSLLKLPIRDRNIKRRGRQRERRKNNRFYIKQNNNLHAFCTFLCPFLHDYDAFYGLRKQASTKFYFFSWGWMWSLGIQFLEGSPHLTKLVGTNNCDKEWKNANSFFKWRSCCRHVVGSYSLYYMAEIASGQDEANPAFWFATREGKMGPSRDFSRWSRKKKFSYWPHNISLIDQLVRSSWL